MTVGPFHTAANLIPALHWERLEPRVHGNGFIQIDLTPKYRLHVWGHPDIPKQSIYTPLHDHIFGFHSMVLVGEMHNYRYRVRADFTQGTHMIWEAQPADDGSDDHKLKMRQGEPAYKPIVCAHEVMGPGKVYYMPAFEFHETMVEGSTATVIAKDGKSLQQNPSSKRKPIVLVPVGTEPDNEFNRHAHDREMLMRITKEVLGI